MPESRIIELAKAILKCSTTIDGYLDENGLPSLSFDLKGPGRFGTIPVTTDIESARVQALEAGTELVELLRGPTGFFNPTYNGASLQALSRWSITQKIPLEGSITYEALSTQCANIPPQALRSLIRHAITHHRLFTEPQPGYIAHSSYSRMLVDEPLLGDMLWLLGDKTFSAHPHLVEALEKWKDAEPSHAATSHAAGKEKGYFALMGEDPALAGRVSRAMKAITVLPRGPFTLITDKDGTPVPTIAPALEYDWSKLGAALIVDVGGSTGHRSIQIARAFPSLRFVIQDLPDAIKEGQKYLPSDLVNRFQFMPYNFMTRQICQAGVYMISMALHNWPDEYVVRILRNQVAAMRSGARILIIDGLAASQLGEGGILAERATRSSDILQLTAFNSYERNKEDFARIIAATDSRLRIESIQRLWDPAVHWQPMGIVEVIFDA